jgi:hypothetical protein
MFMSLLYLEAFVSISRQRQSQNAHWCESGFIEIGQRFALQVALTVLQRQALDTVARDFAKLRQMEFGRR